MVTLAQSVIRRKRDVLRRGAADRAVRLAIEFAQRITTSRALGQAGRPSIPDTPGRPTLRSLSEATNYDQPQVRILLGVLFCGVPSNYFLQLARRAVSVGRYGQASGPNEQNFIRPDRLPFGAHGRVVGNFVCASACGFCGAARGNGSVCSVATGR
jgi:hypothetical protein